MNTETWSTGDDRVLVRLAECDDALAAGRPVTPESTCGRSEWQQLTRGLACIRLLREVLTDAGSRVEDPPAEAQGGTATSQELPYYQLGRYQIRRQLGQGSCGVVFLAYDTKLERETALKVPRGAALVTPWLRERFLREARAAAVLNHPNIIAVYEAGEVGPICYIAAEYCAGITLGAWLRDRTARISVRDAAQFMLTLALAVEHAHERGVLHRDLKPSNIMLHGSGAPGDASVENRPLPALTPKITDFSLAKFFHEADAGQTHSGDIVGTPQYMAPEQAGGKSKAAGPAADVYGLGAIFYELLTGRPPFQGESSLDTLQQVLSVEPIPPRWLNAKVPRDIEIICLECLQKAPDRRYTGARALADDLRRFLADRPIVARPSGRLEVAGRWCRRNPALAVASGLAIAGLLGVTALSALYGFSARRDARRQSQSATDLRAAFQSSEEHRQTSELRLAENYLERARNLNDRGNEGEALLFLVRALEIAPPDEAGLARAIRAHFGSLAGKLHRPSVVLDPKGAVTRVALRADGTMVACARTDGSILLWSAQTGESQGTLHGHERSVKALAFSRDGRTLMSGSEDGSARLWDVATGRPTAAPLRQGNATVSVVCISPDGRTAFSGNADGVGRLWEVSTGRPIGEAIQQPGVILFAEFDALGKVVLSGGTDRTAHIWDAGTGRRLEPQLRHELWVRTAAFSKDGRFILTGSEDCTARLWERKSGSPCGNALAHHDTVRAVAFSPLGGCFATGSADGTAQIWDLATTRPIGKSLSHQQAVSSAAFSPDGTILATGSDDQTVRIWDAQTGDPIGAPLQHAGQVWGVEFSRDGRLMSWGPDDPVRLWHTAAALRGEAVLSHERAVSAVAFSPDGKTVLTGTADKAASRGQVQRWDLRGRRPIGPPITLSAPTTALTFSPDGKLFLTGAGNVDRWHGEAQLWDASTGQPVVGPLAHARAVTAVAFCPDGATFVTASADRTARLWTAAKGSLERTFKHPDYVTAVAISPGGGVLLTGSEDRMARLWDMNTATAIGEPLRHQATIMALAFSADGTTALTGSLDNTAQLWDARSWKPIGRPLRHHGCVTAVALSADGLMALTASADNAIQLWDTRTTRPIGFPFRHESAVLDAEFSPDGGTVLSGSADTSARLWRVSSALEGEVERISLWTQVVTGAELDESDLVRRLDAPTWHDRRRRLEKLGGTPHQADAR